MERKERKRGKERGGTDGVRLSLQEFGRSVKRAYFLVFGHFLHFLHVDRHGDQQHAYSHARVQSIECFFLTYNADAQCSNFFRGQLPRVQLSA